MRRRQRKTTWQPRVNRNHYIQAENMRVIAEDGALVGIYSKADALEMAKKAGKDLVEVNRSTDPVIVKLIEFGKFKYERDRKTRESKRNSQATETKQIRVSLKIGEGDLETKLNKMRKLLEEGHRVRLSMMLKGRENAHKDLAVLRINEISDKISEWAEVELRAKLTGRTASVVYKARPNSNPTKKEKVTPAKDSGPKKEIKTTKTE